MLAKFSRVDPETNKYVKPSSPNLIYGTLTWVRSTIVLQSGGVLARGVTIATRYASVRRQFQDRDAPSGTSGENQVLNYTSKPPCSLLVHKETKFYCIRALFQRTRTLNVDICL